MATTNKVIQEIIASSLLLEIMVLQASESWVGEMPTWFIDLLIFLDGAKWFYVYIYIYKNLTLKPVSAAIG